MILMGGCALLLLFTLLRRPQRREPTTRSLVREQMARLREQRDVSHNMDDLMVQLEELARRINAQVETKFAKLDVLVVDADERIARLEELLGGRRSPSKTGTGITGGQTAPLADKPPVAPGPGKENVPRPLAKREGGEESGPRLGRAAEHIGEIHVLCDAGKKAHQIAAELSLPVGEVQLVLDLREFGRSAEL